MPQPVTDDERDEWYSLKQEIAQVLARIEFIKRKLARWRHWYNHPNPPVDRDELMRDIIDFTRELRILLAHLRILRRRFNELDHRVQVAIWLAAGADITDAVTRCPASIPPSSLFTHLGGPYRGSRC